MGRGCGTMVDSIMNEEGQGLVEYALIIMLVALAVFGALTLLGTNTTGFFSNFVNTYLK
jgi:pilus assembly protein Flp/PilA